MAQENNIELLQIYNNSNIELSFDEFQEIIKQELGDKANYTAESLDKIITRLQGKENPSTSTDDYPISDEQVTEIESKAEQIPEAQEPELSPQDIEQIAQNTEYLESKQDYNPFARTDDGKLKHPEYQEIYNALQKLEFTDENGNPLSEEEQEKSRQALIETALLDADVSFRTDTSLSTKNAEERYKTQLINSMYLAICATAYGSEFDYRNADKKTLAQKAFDVIQHDGTRKIKNSSMINYAGVVSANANAQYNRLNKYANNPQSHKTINKLNEKLQTFDNYMSKAYPKSYPIAKRMGKIFTKRAKNVAIYSVVSAVAGPAGLGVLAVKSAYDSYKSIQQKAHQENLSFSNYAKLHKSEVALAFTTSGISLAMSALGLGIGGEEIAQKVSPILKTTTRVLAVAPSLLKATKHSSKALLTKIGLRKDNIQEELKLAKSAFNQSIDVIAGLTIGAGLSEVASGITANAATPQSPLEIPEEDKGTIEAPDVGQGQEEKIEISPEDRNFWVNRSHQFLGEETTNNLYARIDNNEITLPQGIESKEEFAYKLAMAMEQTPAFVTEALGTEFQTTSQLENNISQMKPDQFAKLGALMNDFDDRGNYIGDRNFERTYNNSSSNEKNENIDVPPATVEYFHSEQPRTEEYYTQELNALNKSENNERSLKDIINMARKDDEILVEDDVYNYMAYQVETGKLSEQQATELTQYVNYELDAHDNKQIDGKVQDQELSRREVRGAMRDVEDTLVSMRDNANEVATAQNINHVIQDKSAEQTPQTHARDTKSSQFYQGMSKVIEEMKDDKAPLHTSMREAIIEGRISEEQATAMNTRFAELKEQGQSTDKALNTMQKDYENANKFFSAQEKIQTLRERFQDNQVASANIGNTGETHDKLQELRGVNNNEHQEAKGSKDNKTSRGYKIDDIYNVNKRNNNLTN